MKLKIPERDLSRLFFTADQHFGANDRRHKLTDRFASKDERDAWCIEQWNATVPPDALVIHAGDLAFKYTERYLDQLNYGRIILVQGNHDEKHNRATRECFWKICEILDLTIVLNATGSQAVTVCHYPMWAWNKSVHGAWLLHGHSHGKSHLPRFYALDIGVYQHDGRPWSWNEIVTHMQIFKRVP